MAFVKVTDIRWPIVKVLFPDEVTPDEFRALFEEYRALSKRAIREGTKLGYVVDFSNYDPIHAPPTIRKIAAETRQEFREIMGPVTAAEGRVVDRAMSRAVLTAFDWLSSPPWPCRNFADEESALEWLRSQLQS